MEIKEIQLKELVRKLSLNTNSISSINATLEEVELIKEELINQLEDELNRIKTNHINMIKTYEAKLIEFGIPIEEIGFEPLIPVDFKQMEEKKQDQSQIKNESRILEAER